MKNFLDPPLDWTRPELIQLRDLFVLAYEVRTDAKQIAEAAGLVRGTFPELANMRATWFELIEEMARQGNLRAMVEKAIKDPRTTAYQQQFREMLIEQPSISALKPKSDEDWWKGTDRDATIARTLHLERLMEQRSRLIKIEIARRVGALSQSVAKLDLSFAQERAYGTGFLIQPDLILTNHHNVLHEKYGNLCAVTAEFDYEEGFVGTPLVVQGKVETIVKDKEHDWAVIQLMHTVERQPISLGSPFPITNNDPVIIIEHPLGAFKQFALDMRSVQYFDDKIVQYLADTQNGSSGSPVFNVRMHLIALHHAEAEVAIDIDGRKEIVWRNEGINIQKVMKGLEAREIKFLSNIS